MKVCIMYRKNKTIDLAKYIASILIIAIHSKQFAEINSVLNFVTKDIVGGLVGFVKKSV